MTRPAVKRATNRGAVLGFGAERARRDVDGPVPLLRSEVHVDERGIDDRVAERISGMATKAFSEFGSGLEPSATSGQRCGCGVELDGTDRGRLQRCDAGEDVVGLLPTAEAHQAAGGDTGVKGPEARLEAGAL